MDSNLNLERDTYVIETKSLVPYSIDTVSPKVIQINKEKRMSISLDGPLVIGSNNLQKQVKQNTEDIQQLQEDVGNLDNLDTTNKDSLVEAVNELATLLPPTSQKDYIDNSKGALSGEVSTNALILPQIQSYAHSTFDSTKFTVVGSPVVTDDGIASGFSGSDYIRADSSIDSSKPFIITGKFNTKTISSTRGSLISLAYSQFHCFYEIRMKDTAVTIVWATGDSVRSSADVTYNFVDNNDYFYKIEFDGTNVKFYLRTASGNFTLIHTATPYVVTVAAIKLGVSYSNTIPFLGSIDLKQFSITVYGVPVFSGNKTGIDTIKSDDYTIVGSPAISADGIASGLSTANYLSGFDVSQLKTKSFEIRGTHTITSTSANIFYTNLSNSVNTFGVKFTVDTNYKEFRFYYKWHGASSGGYRNVRDGSAGANFNVGDTYEWRYKFTYPDKLEASIRKVGNIEWITETSTDTTYLNGLADIYASDNTTVLLLGKQANDSQVCSLDLNTFKVYANGSLEYQPCLKIPFTESKTGSKIVDSIYRDRVNDMAEQFGFAPYYTLQEDKKGNYQVVGSPTISNDFVASGFAASSSIRTPSITFSSDVVLEAAFNLTSLPYYACIVGATSSSTNSIKIAVTTSGELNLWLSSNGTTFDIASNLKSSANLISLNTIYYVKLVFNGSTYKLYYRTSDTDYTEVISVTSSSTLNSAILQIGCEHTDSNYGMVQGSIDLKEFKIYVDNTLAYSAVINPNFTLPMGEVYGMIGQRTLRDSYRNGITYWELYSDRTLEIGGTCTSGIEYNLPKEFVDTNYVLTIPYSAKTTSTFTPSATGDFIAKGIGTL